MTMYIQDKEIRRYPIQMGRSEELNLISIHYLADWLSESQWKTQLYNNEKKKEMNTERRLVLDMLLAVLIDYFRGIVLMTSKEEIDTMLIEAEELRKYYNSVCDSLAKRFENNTFKKISIDWSKMAA